MRYVLTLLFLISIAILGCSGNGGNPVVPASSDQAGNLSSPANAIGSIDNLPIIAPSLYEDGSFNALGMLGAYELHLNPDAVSAELVSKRLPSLGQSWIVSGIRYFTVVPCHDCLKVTSVSLDAASNLVLRFAIRHPFPPGDPAKPPTGMNRLDLDLFDVALVVNPLGGTATTFPLTGKSAFTGILANNAGYTTELAKVTGNQSAVPYVLIIDDNKDGTSTFNKFAMGANKDFDVTFDSSTLPTMNFELYLTMGYGASAANKAGRLSPKYFNPEFNRKPAWKVKVTPPEGTNPPSQANTWNDKVNTAAFNVKVEVWDWQQGVTTIANPPVNPGDIAMSSDVASVSVEIPGMNNTLQSMTTASSGTGQPADPLVYNFPIMNQMFLAAGEYASLVRVADKRAPRISMPPPAGAIDYLIQREKTDLKNYAIPEFATYQTFSATVVGGCGPMTGTGVVSSPNPVNQRVRNGGSLTFIVSGITSNFAVVTYYADWDWDSVNANFTKDASSTSGNFGSHTFNNPGSADVIYTVGFKAEDNCTPPNEYFFTRKCRITVRPTASPVGNVTIVVTRMPLSPTNFRIDAANPWTISWTAAANAEEYAVYWDSNPADGLTNSLALVFVIAGTSCIPPSNHLPTNHYCVGNTYIVRSRSITGDALSENPTNSEPAFVSFTGFESLAVGTNDGEGCLTNCQINNTLATYRPTASAANPADGLRSYMFSTTCSNADNNRWNGFMIATPTVPSSTVRWLECSAYHGQTYTPAGLVYGTSPTRPSPGYNFLTPNIIEWASVSSTSPRTPYLSNSTDVRNNISGVPVIVPTIAWTSGAFTRNFYSGDVNIDGDPTDPNVAVEFVSATYSGGIQPQIYLDELSVTIY